MKKLLERMCSISHWERLTANYALYTLDHNDPDFERKTLPLIKTFIDVGNAYIEGLTLMETTSTKGTLPGYIGDNEFADMVKDVMSGMKFYESEMEGLTPERKIALSTLQVAYQKPDVEATQNLQKLRSKAELEAKKNAFLLSQTCAFSGHLLEKIECPKFMETDQTLMEVVSKKHQWLHEMMSLYPNNLFCAGGLPLGLATRNGHYRTVSDFDIFITATTSDEAEKCLTDCCDHLMKKYPTSKIVTTDLCTTIMVKMEGYYNPFKVQFVRRLYPQGRHNLIIGCFDMWASKVMFSIGHGFQTTLEGLFTIITKFQMMDYKRRSTTSARRIEKYIQAKHITFLFPGFGAKRSDYQEDFNFGTELRDDGSRFETFQMEAHGNGVARFHFERMWQMDGEDYEIPTDDKPEKKTDDEIREIIQENDETDTEANRMMVINLRALKKKKYSFMLFLSDYKNWSNPELLKKDIIATFASLLTLSDVKKRKPKLVRKYFDDDETWKQYVLAAYGMEDINTAYQIWIKYVTSRVEYLIEKYCKEPINTARLWKIDNPGAQSFGQNYQVPTTPLEYCGPTYQPMVIGVDHYRYFLIKTLFKQYGLGRDVVGYFCSILIWAQARDSLNAIVKHHPIKIVEEVDMVKKVVKKAQRKIRQKK